MTLRPCHRATAGLAGLALLATLGLSACGSDDDGDEPRSSASADSGTDSEAVEDYLDDVVRAIVAEEVVSVSGAGEDEDGPLSVDLAFDGDDMSGTIESGGIGFTILKVDGTVWFRPDDAFWTEQVGVPAESLGQVSGRWLLVDPEDESIGDIADFADREDVLEDLLDPDGRLSFGDPERIDGTEYDVVESTSKGETGRLFVDPGTMLPLRLEGKGDLDFAYDEVSIDAPPSDDQLITLQEVQALVG